MTLEKKHIPRTKMSGIRSVGALIRPCHVGSLPGVSQSAICDKERGRLTDQMLSQAHFTGKIHPTTFTVEGCLMCMIFHVDL